MPLTALLVALLALAPPAPAAPSPRARGFVAVDAGAACLSLYGDAVWGGGGQISFGARGAWGGGAVDLAGFRGDTPVGLATTLFTVGGSVFVQVSPRVALALGTRTGMLHVARATFGEALGTLVLGGVLRADVDVAVFGRAAIYASARVAVDAINAGPMASVGLAVGVRAW